MRYWGHGSRMSADLKRTIRRVRARCPEFFVESEIRESNMDSEGRVSVNVRREAKAVPMTAVRRHALSIAKS